MSKHGGEFTPDQVERQIDRLTHFPNTWPGASSVARLISELSRIYTEDEMTAKHAWQRLAERITIASQLPGAGHVTVQPRSPLHALPEQEEPPTMNMAVAKKRPPNKIFHLLEIVAALLVVAALVAGTAMVISSAHQPHTSQPITAPISGTSGLYVTSLNGGVYREDLASGKVLWHSTVSQKGQEYSKVWVVGPVAVFQATAGLVGVDASTGKQLWVQKNIPGNSGLRIAGDGVAITIGNKMFHSASLQEISMIAAYQAATGRRLWSYQPVLRSAWSQYNIALADGVFYLLYDSRVVALQASSGKLLWQRNLPEGFDRVYTTAPIVSGTRLYFINTKLVMYQHGGGSQFWLFTIDTTNGNETWHVIPALANFSPTVVDGVVYVQGFTGHSADLYAYTAENGTFLRDYPQRLNTEYLYPPLPAQNLVIFCQVNGSYPGSLYGADLVAFNTTTRTPAWSVHMGYPNTASDLQVANNIIYVPGDSHIFAYTAAGKLAHDYNIQAQTGGGGEATWDFTVVS